MFAPSGISEVFARRARRTLTFVATMSLCLLVIAPARAAEGTRDPRQFFFAQSFGDLPEELDEARQAGKLGLLLFFEQEGCPYCERMLKAILSQPAVQDWYRARFTPIAVDINGDVELTDVDGITLPSKVFAEHRRVKTTPTLSFLDLHGVEVHRQVKMINSVDEFLLLGRYVAEGHYSDTSWTDYSAASAAAPANHDSVPRVLDFSAEGATAAANGQSLLLAVTREGCSYCKKLRREVLVPIIRGGEYDDRIMVREMMMEPDTAVVDFDGNTSTSAQIASRYSVTIAPTVLLLDPSGTSLHAPIVGINNAEMYGFYLDQAISVATAAAAEQAERQE